MKTPEQKDAMIQKLIKLREILPERSFFGGDNHRKIDAQIEVIKGKDADDYLDTDEFLENQDEIYIAASEAEEWLLGNLKDEDLVSDKDLER